MRLTKAQRAALKQKFGGRCAYCGLVLGDKWHADHAEPVTRQSESVRDAGGIWRRKQTGSVLRPERDTLDNMMPACQPCNTYKSFDDIEQFRRRLERTLESIGRHACYRFAKKYGLVNETPRSVVFYFEQASRKAGGQHE